MTSFTPRRSRRLTGWDYADEGGYFITLVTEQRACLLGEVVNHEMKLSSFGEIVQSEWMRSESIRPDVALDEFVIMPNHLHAILWIARKFESDTPVDARPPLAGAPSRYPQTGLMRPPRSLGSIIAGFKSTTTKQINELRSTPGPPVWQPNYHDRVIRNDYELDRIRTCIAQNPETWAEDSINPRFRD